MGKAERLWFVDDLWADSVYLALDRSTWRTHG